MELCWLTVTPLWSLSSCLSSPWPPSTSASWSVPSSHEVCVRACVCVSVDLFGWNPLPALQYFRCRSQCQLSFPWERRKPINVHLLSLGFRGAVRSCMWMSLSFFLKWQTKQDFHSQFYSLIILLGLCNKVKIHISSSFFLIFQICVGSLLKIAQIASRQNEEMPTLCMSHDALYKLRKILK